MTGLRLRIKHKTGYSCHYHDVVVYTETAADASLVAEEVTRLTDFRVIGQFQPECAVPGPGDWIPEVR